MDDRTWAEQWDTAPHSEPPPAEKKKSGGLEAWKKLKEKLGKTKAAASTKYGKVGEELQEKTKAAAAGGVKKVKEGSSVGIQWIKDKCHKFSH